MSISPGPWRIGPSLCDSESNTVYDIDDEPVIPDVTGVYENHPPDISEANLRLIEAAPEMLELLKEAIAVIGSSENTTLRGVEVISDANRLLTKLAKETP